MANANISTKEAVAEINKLIESFNLLIKATGDVSQISKANFVKVETALNGLKKVSEAATKSVHNMNDAQKQSLSASRSMAKGLEAVAKAADKAEKEQNELDKKVKQTNSSMKAFGSNLKAMISAFGVVNSIQLFANIVKDAYSLIKTFDSLKLSLNALVRDTNDIASSSRFVTEITKDFGVELVATTERWIKFLAAAKQSGVTLKDTEDIFRTMTKAGAVLGLQTDELSTIYLALEQMMSKGKITTEELRRQLGERLPGAVGIMAAAIGVNVNQLDSMLKKGEVLSAEVLPKFAEALEAAYGIETVKNIETITAAQTDLTNAWQTFVKGVSENKGVVAGALNLVGMSLKGLLHLLTSNAVLEEQKYQNTVIKNKKEFEERFEKDNQEHLDRLLGAGMKYQDVKSRRDAAAYAHSQAVLSGAKQEEIDILQQTFAKEQKLLNDYNEKLKAIQHTRSVDNLKMAQDRFTADSAAVKALEAEIERTKEWKLTGNPRSREAVEELLVAAKGKKAAAEALLEIYRLGAEVSTASKFVEEAEKKSKPAKFLLKDVKDLTNELRLAYLKGYKEINDEILNSGKESAEAMQEAALNNVDIEIEIANSKYAEAVEQANKYHDDLLNDRNRAIKEGKIIIGNQAEWELELAKNLSDALKIANENKNQALLGIEKKFENENLKIQQKIYDDKLALEDQLYNEAVIKAKEKYELSAKTYEDQEALEKELSNLSVEYTNKRIDAEIVLIEAKKASGLYTEEEIKALDKIISKLKSMKEFVKVEKPEDKDFDYKDALDMAKQYADAIEDLGSNIYDRRIENINAEIDAEAKKYDRLIDLAYQNEDEQQRLRIQKEARIRELEAKRLKEEQKKAKFEKAMAITKILISTAVAIAENLKTPWMIPLIAGLGAVQLAAVVAQPIPQYKQGLKDAKEDHIGMINDGGQQEFIERDGALLTTKTKNAIVAIKKGDTIHKSLGETINSSELLNNITKAAFMASLHNNTNSKEDGLEKVFDKHLESFNNNLKKGIREGFGRVTINNSTTYDASWSKYRNDTL